MRKRLLISLAIGAFISLQTIQCQEGWNFGLNGGMNMSWVKVEVNEGEPLDGEFGNKYSYTAGLFGEYGFNNRIFFQIGFNIDHRGFKYAKNKDDIEIDITVKASYLEVPLLFRYMFVDREAYGIYGLLGPSFSFLVGGKIKGKEIDNGEEYPIDEKISSSHDSSDIGLKMGLGAEFPFPDDRGAFFFDVRYNLGFTDNITQGGYYASSDVDAKSKVLSFVIGVRGYID